MSSSDPRTRRVITRAWQIPTCEGWIWSIEPDPETGLGGAGHACKARASHHIAAVRYTGGAHTPADRDVCRAHLAAELDHLRREHAWTWRLQRVAMPAPTITALTLTVDVRGWAHGHKRWHLTETDATTTVIALELFSTSPPIPTPPPRRDRTARPGAPAPQLALFTL
ncbi:hypothetical protein [Nocardia sp. XZ_19_369]|uniref:hypothetical protein n=1 Tax=Nocardia sp. XZ_19_369 TaxID=2769487 RepID=UPI0018900B9B|nr:hypothetical protein [Nocardia sp. XZ_19_369]